MWMTEGSGNRASISEGALWGEPRGRAPLLGTLKDMLNKALKIGICFHRGPILGNMGGTLVSWGLWERREISFIIRRILWGVQEIRKRRLWKQATLSIRAPVGKPGGVRLPGLFERHMKEGSGNGAPLTKLNSAPFLDPDYVTSLSMGAIRNCCEGSGLPWLGISLWGTKGLSIRPRCIGTVRARTQLLFYTPLCLQGVDKESITLFFFKTANSKWSMIWARQTKDPTYTRSYPTRTEKFSKLKTNREERNARMTYILCNTPFMTVSSSPKFVISKVSTSWKKAKQNRCK
jgi:hypothetical protein